MSTSADDANESGNGAQTRVRLNLLPTQPQFPPLAGPSAAQAAALPLRSLERIDMADRSRFRRLYPSKREVLRRWSLGRIHNEAYERQIKVSFKHGDGRSISSVAHSGKRLLAHYDYLAEQLHWQEWYRRRLAAGMEPDPCDDEHSSGGHSASGERSAPHSSPDEVEEMSASGASGTFESDSASGQSPAISQRPESSSPPAEHTATAAEGSPPPGRNERPSLERRPQPSPQQKRAPLHGWPGQGPQGAANLRLLPGTPPPLNSPLTSAFKTPAQHHYQPVRLPPGVVGGLPDPCVVVPLASQRLVVRLSQALAPPAVLPYVFTRFKTTSSQRPTGRGSSTPTRRTARTSPSLHQDVGPSSDPGTAGWTTSPGEATPQDPSG